MTTPPFKKGDEVMLLKEWRVKGTVFFVRKEAQDVVFYSWMGKPHKKASAGDYTIGVKWEDVSNRSFHNMILLNKWQNAKNLVLFDNHPEKANYLRVFGK